MTKEKSVFIMPHIHALCSCCLSFLFLFPWSSGRMRCIKEELLAPTHDNVVCYIQGREFYSCANLRDSGGCGVWILPMADKVLKGGASGSGSDSL